LLQGNLQNDPQKIVSSGHVQSLVPGVNQLNANRSGRLDGMLDISICAVHVKRAI
jgi:hypothetical protein